MVFDRVQFIIFTNKYYKSKFSHKHNMIKSQQIKTLFLISFLSWSIVACKKRKQKPNQQLQLLLVLIHNITEHILAAEQAL